MSNNAESKNISQLPAEADERIANEGMVLAAGTSTGGACGFGLQDEQVVETAIESPMGRLCRQE